MKDDNQDVEIVEPFLKEWQKVIKGRMKKEDMERAKISAEKREANIMYLKNAKGPDRRDRVLEGLLADFMAAV